MQSQHSINQQQPQQQQNTLLDVVPPPVPSTDLIPTTPPASTSTVATPSSPSPSLSLSLSSSGKNDEREEEKSSSLVNKEMAHLLLARCSQERDALKVLVDEQTRKIEEQERRVMEIQALVDVSANQVATLQAEAALATAKAASYKEAADTAEARCVAMFKERREKEDQLTALKGERARLKAQLSSSPSPPSSPSSSSSSSSLSATEDKNSPTTPTSPAKSVIHTEQYQALLARLRSLESEHEKALHSLGVLEVAKARLTEEVVDLNTENDTLWASLERYEEALGTEEVERINEQELLRESEAQQASDASSSNSLSNTGTKENE